MNSNLLVLPLALAAVLLAGCNGGQGGGDLAYFKGIQSAKILDNCMGERGDVCGLFDCMVENCWCADLGPGGPMLSGGAGICETKDRAMSVVRSYLESSAQEYAVDRAVELNSVFFNVFALNAGGDEKVFTVAKDCSIISTMCGV